MPATRVPRWIVSLINAAWMPMGRPMIRIGIQPRRITRYMPSASSQSTTKCGMARMNRTKMPMKGMPHSLFSSG